MVEHAFHKREVVSSILTPGTMIRKVVPAKDRIRFFRQSLETLKGSETLNGRCVDKNRI